MTKHIFVVAMLLISGAAFAQEKVRTISVVPNPGLVAEKSIFSYGLSDTRGLGQVYYFPLTNVGAYSINGGIAGNVVHQQYAFLENQVSDVYTASATDSKIDNLRQQMTKLVIDHVDQLSNQLLLDESSPAYKALVAKIMAEIEKKYILTPRN
ncbi:MAG TPA: hypothetical protein VGQ59_07110 [Cyclobacteriaceae bacterium]|jgi:hypothetical protein|nr:hypothetical protein [Cyclobacteriaceae bacterium]